MALPLSDKEKQIRKHAIERWSQSKLSGVQWCRKQNIPYNQFVCWKSQVAKWRRKPKSKKTSQFVEIGDKPSNFSGVRIDFQNLSIHLEVDFDKNTLMRCLETFRM